MKAALLAILFVSLLPSILAAAGGWRFAHGASALGEVTVATNVSNATASVKPGDFLPPAGYFEAETGAIEITLTGGNLKDPFVTTFVPPSGYSTLVAAGTAPSLKTFSDSISTAQKLIGGSVLSAVRLINGVNNSVTLKFNGTGYSDFVVASTDGFLDASDYQTVPSRDVEGTFFIVDAQGNMLAEAAGTLDVEAVYTAFFSESTDTDGTHLKLKLAEDQPTLTVSYVRAVHAVPDLKNKVDVDVVYSVLANATVAANISYFTVSDFVATQPGNNEVLLRVHGGNESSVDFPFANFANYTVLVFGFANSSQIEVIPDTLTTSNNSALVRIINVIPGTPVTTASIQDSSNSSKTVSLNTTTPAADAAIYLAVTGASTVKAQIVSGKSASPVDYTFNKNTVYTVWIYGTPTKPQIEVTQDYPTPPTANGLSNLELGLIIAGAIMFVILLLAIIIFAVRSRPAEGYERIEN